MLTEERQAYILDRVNKFNTVKLKDLVIELGASESTIRRDFDDLEDKGLIKRVHGGAMSIDGAFTFDNTIFERSERALSEKIAIGRYCGNLVKDGDFVYIDAGTTCYEIIPFLRGKDIVVVTNGIHNVDIHRHIPLHCRPPFYRIAMTLSIRPAATYAHRGDGTSSTPRAGAPWTGACTSQWSLWIHAPAWLAPRAGQRPPAPAPWRSYGVAYGGLRAYECLPSPLDPARCKKP